MNPDHVRGMTITGAVITVSSSRTPETDESGQVIKDLLRVTGERKKTKAICIALDDYIRSRRREKLLALSGKVEFDLDWQKMEEMELEGMKSRETRRKPR